MRKRLSAILLTVFVIMTMAVGSFASYTENNGNPDCDHNIGFSSIRDDANTYVWEYCLECDYATHYETYPHLYLEGSECYDCGYTCTHSAVTNGVCNYCGYNDPDYVPSCEHEYQFWDFDGLSVCVHCGYVCPHPSYSDTLNCVECGVEHYLVRGARYEGYQDGMANGKTEGYTNGYAEGEADGYTNGKADGYTNGYTEGEADGYTNGYAKGKTDGITEGYIGGYGRGELEGYQNGYNDGRIQGQADDVGNMLPAMFDGLFDSVGGFMNVFLNLGIGGITIGALLGLTLTVLLVLLVVKIIRGS